MKKLKGLVTVVIAAVTAPELRPAEVKIARAALAAAVAYLGIHYGQKA